MNKVLIALTVVVALFGAAVGYQMQQIPSPVATSVIGEKPGKTMGNQVASLIPETLNLKQSRLLKIAYEMGKKEGFKNPEIIQSLILQETLAGGLKSYKVANPGPEAYFGPLQIKLAATKDVLQKHPELYSKYDFHTRTDDEIKANLILNEKFNIEVGTKYLKILQTTYGFQGRQLLNAYNRGPGGVHGVDDSYHYARGAEAKLSRYKANGKVS